MLQRRGPGRGNRRPARRAVELEPQRARWRDHLAALLGEAGRLEEAEAVLREALERNIESGVLYWRLSRLLQWRERADEALAGARRAVELDAAEAVPARALVALLMATGEDDEAEAALRGRRSSAIPARPGCTFT